MGRVGRLLGKQHHRVVSITQPECGRFRWIATVSIDSFSLGFSQLIRIEESPVGAPAEPICGRHAGACWADVALLPAPCRSHS